MSQDPSDHLAQMVLDAWYGLALFGALIIVGMALWYVSWLTDPDHRTRTFFRPTDTDQKKFCDGCHAELASEWHHEKCGGGS